MDPQRFDRLSKGLASRSSRRAVVKGLGGGVLGGALALVGLDRASAKPPKVAVCHLTGNATNPVVQISVSQSAANTLVSRGDTLLGSTTDCAFCGDFCESQDACVTPYCGSGVCAYDPVDPVDCEVSEWSEWSACSADCGGGAQTRTRTIVTDVWCGGEACPELSESQACNTDSCVTPGCSNAFLSGPGGILFCVDDEISVYVNDGLVLEHLGTAICYHDPVSIGPVTNGDTIRVVANNSWWACGDVSMDPISLTCADTGVEQVLDAVGYPGGTQADCGAVFYDKSFTVAL